MVKTGAATTGGTSIGTGRAEIAEHVDAPRKAPKAAATPCWCGHRAPVAACIPNFAIQEYPSRTPELEGDSAPLGNDIATGLSDHVGGFLPIPDAPGIGLTLVDDIERRFPPKPRPIRMRPHVDGSVVDM